MTLSTCRMYLPYVPIDNVKKNRAQTGSYWDYFQYFWISIAQNNCSNENNISVYVQQIFQKLKLFQNIE